MAYAPQSPDLSSFLSGSPTRAGHPQSSNPQQHQRTSSGTLQTAPATQSYAPRSPNLSDFSHTGQPTTFSPRAQPPARSLDFAAYPSPARHHRQEYVQGSGGYSGFDDPLSQTGQSYPIPGLPQVHELGIRQQQQQQQQQQDQYQRVQQAVDQQHLHQQYIQQFNPPALPHPPFKTESSLDFPRQFSQASLLDLPSDPQQSHTATWQPAQDMSSRPKRERNVGKTIKEENGTSSVPNLGPSRGIDVKTKFPVARIKRIMQADEEVGKVAQVTPVAVSKALELFMISLVSKSADLARAGNSKRVTAQHLKKAIEIDEQFDFLNDIVSKVVEGPEAGGKRVKDEDDSEEEGDAVKKKAKSRKKKGE